MSLSIEQLKAAFKTTDTQQSRPNNYYPFWNMKEGERAVIRFLPDKDPENPLGFMVEKLQHTLIINGEKKTVPCLKMYDDDCPICKVSAAYYKAEDKPNGKKYWRNKQHVVQAMIVEDPLAPDADSGETHEGKVRFIQLGYQLFNIIKEAFESGDLDEVPYMYENGCDFVIKKTKQGDYASYAVGSGFARKSSDLNEDQIALVEEDMIELSTLLPAKPELAKVEGMLEAALTGEDYVEEKADDAAKPASKPAAEKAESKPAAEKAEVKEEAAAEESTEEFDDDVDDMLAQIRARQANK